MWRRVLLALGGAALVLAGACADGGPADDRGARTAAAFDDLGEATLGCAVAVRHPDGIYLDEFGSADLASGEAITESTVFDIGSVSKQITAGAVARLVVDGEVALDEPVADLLPEKVVGAEALTDPSDEITVGDLLHHTIGLPDYVDLLDAEVDEVTTADDALEVLASEEGAPTADPGMEFEYSNTNYFLLGQVVEEVRGHSLVVDVAEEVFAPLGMDDSVIRDDQGQLGAGQARGYEPAEGGWRPVGSAWRQTGDGAVHSTASDLLRWAALFLDEPACDGLGSPVWLDVMVEPGPLTDVDGVGYAGGIEVVETQHGVLLRHGGSWIGYSSALVIDPTQGLAVAVTCNIDGFDAEDRADVVLEVWRG